MGIVENATHIIGSSLRRSDSILCLLGATTKELGGSVYARIHGLTDQPAPATNAAVNLANYRAYHAAVKAGLILSTHDVSEGGLAVAAAEMAFSMKAGMELVIPDEIATDEYLFSETPGRFLIEISPANLASAQQALPGLLVLGNATDAHQNLKVSNHVKVVIDEPLAKLKSLWKSGLTKFY
jgi:phosphoribosylformylglycinamidine synthase